MEPPFSIWLKAALIKNLDWLSTTELRNGQGELITLDQFLNIWIAFLTFNNFLKLYGTPESPKGYLIARPVRMGWVFDTDIDYFKTLFTCDPSGEVVWIDSLWAPGFYANVVEFLRFTEKPYVAWSHKKKLYFKVIRELTGQVPLKSEIEEAFVRNV